MLYASKNRRSQYKTLEHRSSQKTNNLSTEQATYNLLVVITPTTAERSYGES
jgi:hypothetical protein